MAVVRAALLGVVALVAALLACGAPSRPGVLGEDLPYPSLADAGAGDAPAARDAAEGSAPPLVQPGVDCPPSARLVYVTGEGNSLYSFDPEAGRFTLIGRLTCLASPTHMTVDRHGTAWVVSDGRLYTASTTDASCSAVPTWKPDPDFIDFALTFLGTTSAADGELYVLGPSGKLGRFDVASGSLTVVGTVPLGTQAHGDMTTNGDGTLYFTSDILPAQKLDQIDPSSGAILASTVTGLDDSTMSGALAYYGGLFFVFIGPDVTTFDVATRTATPIGQSPLQVTGAGQSTCVPTVAPPPAMLQ